MNTGIGFEILHYKTFNETKKCIESILKNSYDSPIVVVDNGSNNGSGEKLKSFFSNYRNVYILIYKDNLGFAKGNNRGITFLRQNFNPEFICIMNNDTEITQNDIYKILEKEYQKSDFAVLGPQIITLDGKNISSPVEVIVESKKQVRDLLCKRYLKLFLNKIHLNCLLHNAGEGSKHIGLYDNNKRYENVKIHGACWFFSKTYFKYFDGLNENTFLYFEEDLLLAELRKKNLKTVYNPTIKILHHEDASTNSIVNSKRDKNIFVLKHEIQSLKVLYKYVD